MHRTGRGNMIVIRFKVTCRPDKVDQVRAAFEDVVAPSRAVDGVLSFDIANDLTDPCSFVATEVFEDQAARDRQESLPEVGVVMGILPEALAAPPEATAFEVASSVPAM
jgi:quinol monooxygenase YgiN